MAGQSTLVILVPEAESLVGPFREKYDPSAAAGLPAHITLLYPFKPPDLIGGDVIDALGKCFQRFTPFAFALAAIRHFPEVLYLAPEPSEPFRLLTLAICDRYPETPPYGGRYPSIVPHLTVAQIGGRLQLEKISSDFVQASQGKLPLSAAASEVALMDSRSGRWEVRAKLGLG
jgi:2'-5' RNA ligase